MAKSNETIPLLLALMITVSAIGGAGWWLLKSPQSIFFQDSNTSNGQADQATIALTDRLSSGEKILITEDTNPAKQQGVTAFAQGDYASAITSFEQSLKLKPNDPETLIYLNNAKIAEKDTYTLAIAVPIGKDENSANAAKEMLRGVAQAQQEINAKGGINGHFLKIIIADDVGDKVIAKQIAQKITEMSNVLGVIGHFSSDNSLEASTVYQENKLVMISPTSTSTELSGKGDYIFRTVPNDKFTANTLAKYFFQTLKLQKVAIFYNAASNYSKSIKDSFTTEVFSQGGNVVAEFDVADKAFNPATALQDARKQGAEAIALLTNAAMISQTLQVIQVNDGNLPMIAGDSLYKPEILQIGGRDSVGLVVAIPWHILSHPNDNFTKNSRQLWGAEVNWRTALSYDATEAFITALKTTTNPTREGLQKVLKNSDFSAPGAATTVRFLPSGDRNQPIQLVKVVKGDRSGYGYDFIPTK